MTRQSGNQIQMLYKVVEIAVADILSYLPTHSSFQPYKLN